MAGNGLRWTEKDLADHEARRGVSVSAVYVPQCPDDAVESGHEGDLQGDIEQWCDDHGYPWFHDRSRGCNEPGFPDLVIALPERRTLWIECKTRMGKMKPDQKRWRLMLLHLGHEHHIVKSFKQFLRIVHAKKGDGSP